MTSRGPALGCSFKHSRTHDRRMRAHCAFESQKMNDVQVIDADGHVLENDNELEDYFEGPYKGVKRSGVFSIFPSLDGWPRGFVRGLDKISRTPADVWIRFVEQSKLEAAVLYPTAGLSFGLQSRFALERCGDLAGA